MAAKAVTGIFFVSTKEETAHKEPSLHTQNFIYDVLSLFHYHFLYQLITIPFNGDVIDAFIQMA